MAFAFPWLRDGQRHGVGIPFIDYALGNGEEIGPGQAARLASGRSSPTRRPGCAASAGCGAATPRDWVGGERAPAGPALRARRPRPHALGRPARLGRAAEVPRTTPACAQPPEPRRRPRRPHRRRRRADRGPSSREPRPPRRSPVPEHRFQTPRPRPSASARRGSPSSRSWPDPGAHRAGRGARGPRGRVAAAAAAAGSAEHVARSTAVRPGDRSTTASCCRSRAAVSVPAAVPGGGDGPAAARRPPEDPRPCWPILDRLRRPGVPRPPPPADHRGQPRGDSGRRRRA